MNNFSIFYHIWSPANTDLWKFIVDEQLKRLYLNNLNEFIDIYCTISGPQAKLIEKYVSLYEWVKIIDVSEIDTEFEGFTLKNLYEYAVKNQNAQAVMYFHTKGISHLSGQSNLCKIPGIDLDRMFKSVNSWRHQLEWGVIDNWKEAINKLNSHHVVGVNYSKKPWPHMSGNFWWARADYIRTLNHPILTKYSYDSNDFGDIERMKHEKWIGTQNPKVFSFNNAPSPHDDYDVKPDVEPQSFEPKYFWPYRDDILPYLKK